MLSKVSFTSVTLSKSFSYEESKLTSLIGITIFNNGPQFIMGEEETLRSMISAGRNVPRYHKLPGRETIRGLLLDKCFEKNINNQCEKLINREDIYELHFQGDGETIKDTSLLNILDEGVYLPVSVQNIVDFTYHTIGVHKKDYKLFAESFFDTLDDLGP